ncbi:hypothetical protein XA68_13547 [Ophiocordyceps unilateralis]|uniref:Uncharacterized protein n=1 Tax=Ophiocordyceps unilateralis TaxID=268505 RepID=A0A2A9PCI6_OPHUN|nr:hypothetical protein XA68_13547 [Ophiocordyceps unilateralis]
MESSLGQTATQAIESSSTSSPTRQTAAQTIKSPLRRTTTPTLASPLRQSPSKTDSGRRVALATLDVNAPDSKRAIEEEERGDDKKRQKLILDHGDEDREPFREQRHDDERLGEHDEKRQNDDSSTRSSSPEVSSVFDTNTARDGNSHSGNHGAAAANEGAGEREGRGAPAPARPRELQGAHGADVGAAGRVTAAAAPARVHGRGTMIYEVICIMGGAWSRLEHGCLGFARHVDRAYSQFLYSFSHQRGALDAYKGE